MLTNILVCVAETRGKRSKANISDPISVIPLALDKNDVCFAQK